MAALKEYALKSGCPLRIAVFWRTAGGLWTLTPPGAFTSAGTVDLPTALMWNDMVRFGDYMLGTVYPLRLTLITVPAGPNKRRITSSDFFAADTPLRAKEDRNLALFLMIFGDWTPASAPPRSLPDAPIEVNFEVRPARLGNPDQRFEMVGFASSLLSRYHRAVVRDDRTAREFIPPDFAGLVVRRRSEALPLWRFEVTPNQTELELDVTSRLNAVYSREPSSIDEAYERASSESAGSEDW